MIFIPGPLNTIARMSDFSELTDKFKKFHHYDRFIGVLDDDNYLKIATTAYDVLKKISTFLPMVKRDKPKNTDTSEMYRYIGNDVFESKAYETAFQLYNLAVIHAPLGSRELIAAYSNRSAVLCKIKKYSAALIDIEKCLSLDCSQELKNKLKKRKEECVSNMWQEDVAHNNELGELNDAKASVEFFKVSGKRNPKYPFAKNAVNIVLKDGKETIVAQSDIKLGEIIVIETAFVSGTLETNKLVLCYNCNKASYNMIPCKTCAHVVYCDEACRDQCWKEFHNIECPMMEIYTCLPFWSRVWMKFVFKTWNMNKDLKKFAEISNKIDTLIQGKAEPSKLEMDKVETFLHPPAQDCVRRYGYLYNAALYASLIIHGLKSIPVTCFGNEKREAVIKHMIKQFMYHSMHTPPNSISGGTLEMNDEDVTCDSCESVGYFPFISRCRHDCNANTLSVGLGNKMALIATLPIKAGTEVTLAIG